MDFNLRAMGAQTVMVDKRLAAKLAEAELLLRDGEKLPYEEKLNKFIRQNSFIGINPSERMYAKCAITGKPAECIGVTIKRREIMLAEEVYYRLQEPETADLIQREHLRKSKDGNPVKPLYEVRTDYRDSPSLSEEENRFLENIRPRNYCFEAPTPSEAALSLQKHDSVFFSHFYNFLKEEKEAGIIDDIISREFLAPNLTENSGVRYGNLFIKTDFDKDPVISCVYEKEKNAWRLQLDPKRLLKYDLAAIQKHTEHFLAKIHNGHTKVKDFWKRIALPEIQKFFDQFKNDAVEIQVKEDDMTLESSILKNCDRKILEKLPLQERVNTESERFFPQSPSDDIEPAGLDDKPKGNLRVHFSLDEKEAAKQPKEIRELLKEFSLLTINHTFDHTDELKVFYEHDKQHFQELFNEQAEKKGIKTNGLLLFSKSSPMLKISLDMAYGSFSLPLENPGKPPISDISEFNEKLGCYETEFIPRNLYGTVALKEAWEKLGLNNDKSFPFSEAAEKSGIDRKVLEEASKTVRQTVREGMEDFRFSFQSQKLLIPKEARDLTEALRFTIENKTVSLAKEIQERRNMPLLSKEHQENLEKLVKSYSQRPEFQAHPQLSEALKNSLEEKFKAAEKASIRLEFCGKDATKTQELER